MNMERAMAKAKSNNVITKLSHVPDEFGRVKEDAKEAGAPPKNVIYVRSIADWRSGFNELTSEDCARALAAGNDGDMSAQMALYNEIVERDTSAAGAMQTRQGAPSGLDGRILPAENTGNDRLAKEVRDYVAEVVGAMETPLDEIVHDCGDGIGKGVSALEIHWRSDGTPAAVEHIDPTLYQFTKLEGEKRQRFALLPTDQFLLKPIVPPPAKLVLHHAKTRSGHPSRAGVLRTIIWPWLFRNFGLKDWSIFSEVYGMPMRVGLYKPGTPEPEQLKLAAAVRDIASDQAVTLSENTRIELLQLESKGEVPYPEFYRIMRSELFFGILGQDQTNSQNPYGNRAQTEAGGARVRQDLLELDCRGIQRTIRRDLFWWIVLFKYRSFDTANLFTPTYKLRYESPIDQPKVIQVHTALIDRGFPFTHGLASEIYGLPLPKGADPEALLKPPVSKLTSEPGADDEDEGEEPKGKKQMSELREKLAEKLFSKTVGNMTDTEQRAIDDLIVRATNRGVRAVSRLTIVPQQILKESKSYEEAERRLEAAFPDMDEDEFAELLGEVQFAMTLAGQASFLRQIRK